MAYTYKLLAGTDAVFRSDGATVPKDTANTDWKIYQLWIAGGGIPTPAMPQDPPPALRDANTRIDAGISAAMAAVVAARDGIHDIAPSGDPARLDALLVQLNTLSDALVAMLQAQNTS